MSELKARKLFEAIPTSTAGFYQPGAFVDGYLKSEADKVIAELKQKINEAQTELELWRDGSIISEAHQKELDEKRHSNYKRCLAMAKWCDDAARLATWDTDFHRCRWYNKWMQHWLELADKFKEAK